MTSRVPALTALLLAVALVVAGCGGSAKEPRHTPTASAQPSVTLPTAGVSVPAGVTITPPGTKLSFGQSATVAYVPNSKRSSVLQLTVTGVRQGRISDLAAYVLDKRARSSTPYYVHVKVKNVGTGDVGHTDVPVWLVDQDNTLIHASGFTNRFAACPSTALPASFAAGAAESTCLLYLVPDHGTVTAMSFRPLQAYEPITWTGPVTKPRHQKAQHQRAHHKKHGKKKH